MRFIKYTPIFFLIFSYTAYASTYSVNGNNLNFYKNKRIDPSFLYWNKLSNSSHSLARSLPNKVALSDHYFMPILGISMIDRKMARHIYKNNGEVAGAFKDNNPNKIDDISLMFYCESASITGDDTSKCVK